MHVPSLWFSRIAWVRVALTASWIHCPPCPSAFTLSCSTLWTPDATRRGIPLSDLAVLQSPYIHAAASSKAYHSLALLFLSRMRVGALVIDHVRAQCVTRSRLHGARAQWLVAVGGWEQLHSRFYSSGVCRACHEEYVVKWCGRCNSLLTHCRTAGCDALCRGGGEDMYDSVWRRSSRTFY